MDALPPVVTSSLADALPLFLYSGGCFAAVVVLFGRCLATVSCFVLALPWHLWRQYFVQVLLFGWPLIGWLVWSVLPLRAFSVVTYCVSGYSHFVCLSVLFLQCFFIFSPLCSCAGQVLFGRNKFVSVTAFFLMKNVLSHDREKKSVGLYHNIESQS